MSAGPEEISHAIARLQAGRLVAFPTETVYGLGADAFNTDAVAGVFEAKGRPAINPLIVHVSSPDMAQTAVRDWPAAARKLADRFWPGPLSMVLPKSLRIPANVTAGGETVAVRCPDHPLTLALIEAFGSPLVGPSANPSGHVSPTTAEHVRAAFTEDLVYVLDGGPCIGGIESTVIDLSSGAPRILRPGLITPDAISAVLGVPVQSAGNPSSPPLANEALKSPGLLEKHYAPRSPARLIEATDFDALPTDAVVLSTIAIHGHRHIPMPADPLAYAHNLYNALRQADESHPSLIAVVRPAIPDAEPDRSLWLAIMDRLTRATA